MQRGMLWQGDSDVLESCVLGCCSVELRLRFPGTDLWSGHKALQSEVSLMFLLLGAVYVHHLPQLLTQLGIDPLVLDTSTPVHILATVAVLTLPGAAAAATDGLMRLVAGELLLLVAGGVALCCDVLCRSMLCCAALCCAGSPTLWHDLLSVTVLHCRKGKGVICTWPAKHILLQVSA